MRIVAVPGRLVRDPVTRRVVDDEGITVDPHDPLWTRLLADGDVARADDETASEAGEKGAKAKTPAKEA